MQDFGETLAPMDPVFPAPQNIEKADDSHLRWAYRSEGDSGFVFVNNYERLQNLTDKKGVRFTLCGLSFPSRPITIPGGTVCIFPVNISGLDYATAQLIAKRDGKVYLEQIPGIETELSVDGKIIKKLKPLGPDTPVYKNYYLLTSDEASKLFFNRDTKEIKPHSPYFKKINEAGAPRQITIGVNKVAEAPTDIDFKNAAVYKISGLPGTDMREGCILKIKYRGDVARLYCDGKLIADNFYNGRPMLYGLWRLPHDATELELRILPLQENMPVYFPEEANTCPGEKIEEISIESVGI